MAALLMNNQNLFFNRQMHNRFGWQRNINPVPLYFKSAEGFNVNFFRLAEIVIGIYFIPR